MAKVKVLNLGGESVGEIELSDEVFGADVNEPLLYEVLKAQLASKRSGSANTKTRSEVAGSSKKIYKQKGTGRGRHGSIRAPNFVGGGQQHGPKPRSYAYRPPAKMRAGALRSALSLKLKEGRLTIVDTFTLDEVKTKSLANVLAVLKVAKGSLIVDQKDNEKLRLSARNLDTHQFLPPEGVNLYDLLRHEHLVLTKNAVLALVERIQKSA
jgi:large subunit ribosomal protein L4